MNDQGADFIYTGQKPAPFMLPNGLREILDRRNGTSILKSILSSHFFDVSEWNAATDISSELNFIKGDIHAFDGAFLSSISKQ